MDDVKEHRLFQKSFSIDTSLNNYQPVLSNQNKIYLNSLHKHVGYNKRDLITYSRWSDITFKNKTFDLSDDFKLDIKANSYEYASYDRKKEMHWFKNFADPNLFYAYFSALFAQDEVQVAEHPILANLLEALKEENTEGSEAITITKANTYSKFHSEN